jgi:hypothetical protein
MNRKEFFKRLGLITAAAAIVPEIIAKESIKNVNAIEAAKGTSGMFIEDYDVIKYDGRNFYKRKWKIMDYDPYYR